MVQSSPTKDQKIDYILVVSTVDVPDGTIWYNI